jgi:hypothetical protein
MSAINEAIDTAMLAVGNIKTDGSISKAEVKAQIGNAKSQLTSAIRNHSVEDCRTADVYFQQKIGSIKNEFLTISASFKKTLANKKERKVSAKKLNYKKLVNDTFKTESKKVSEAIKTVDQSGGIGNVEKINIILRNSVRDVVIELSKV